MRVAVLTPDDKVRYEELDFAGCQKAVAGPTQPEGGYVELINLAPGVWAYVNEDGIALGLPRNELATRFCRRLGPNISMADHIKGVMIVTGQRGTHSVSAKVEELLAGLLPEAGAT